MDGILKSGTKMLSLRQNEYLVIRLLGFGGQGEVYEVDYDNKLYALKWYFKHTATKEQREIIEKLIGKGAPSSMFLWPCDLIISEDSFGYIMPIRPKEYKSIVDMMKRRAEPSFKNLCKAAYNLTVGYQKLHSNGFSYRDISFGNVFFNPDNGDVLICDNDNVTVNGKGTSVSGTPRFMAPEIVRGEKKPSTDTDLYSMSVLLFYMFMLHHPLEGKREANIKCLDINAMNLIYGKAPLFIFDPLDKSNAPIPGYQDNALIYWDLYPAFFKKLFIESFTTGLRNPNKRIVERVWQDNLIKLMNSIIICPQCGAESFYDIEREKVNAGHVCWNCQGSIPIGMKLELDRATIILNPDFILSSHNVNKDYDIDTKLGSISRNPENKNLWGLKNESPNEWTYIKADGTVSGVGNGKSAPIIKGCKIDFGNKIGEFV